MSFCWTNKHQHFYEVTGCCGRVFNFHQHAFMIKILFSFLNSPYPTCCIFLVWDVSPAFRLPGVSECWKEVLSIEITNCLKQFGLNSFQEAFGRSAWLPVYNCFTDISWNSKYHKYLLMLSTNNTVLHIGIMECYSW